MKLHERAGGEGPAEGFLDVSWLVHGDDPCWVPEGREALEARLGPQSPWFREGAGRTFCVPRHARASVFRKPGLEVDGTPAAFFGHWASTGDARAETLVMDAVRAWAHEEGAARLYGPVDLTPAIAHLVRVSGGEGQPPYTGEPYNPPGYAAGFEALGLEVDRRYVSAELGEAEMRAFGDVAASTHADLLDRGYRFERLTVDLWARYGDELLGLNIFAGNFGASSSEPPSLDQLRAVFDESWAARLDPEISLLVFGPDGDLAGFTFCYPDYGPLLAQGAGDARVALQDLSYAKHAPRLRAEGHTSFVLKTGGAAPRHRRGGLALAGAFVSITWGLQKGMTQMITGPMHSENPIRRVFRHGQQDERWYAIYATDLARA